VRRQRSHCLAAGFAVALVCLATTAGPRAAEQEPAADGHFALEIEQCPRVAIESVRRILSIEVGDLLLSQSSAPSAGSDRLEIRCAGTIALVEAAGHTAEPPSERIVRLDDFPSDAVPRVLALAGLELMAARNSTVRDRMAAKPPAAPPSATLAAKEATPSPSAPRLIHDMSWGPAATWRTFVASDGASAWGGQLQVSAAVGGRWHFAADAEAAWARKDAGNSGQVNALLLSVGSTVGLRGERGRLGASLGLGGRIGAVRLSGVSADSAAMTNATVWHSWGGPLVAAALTSRFRWLVLALSAEVGRSLLESEGQVRTTAGDTRAISIGGWWAALCLGARR
jgi:hypothetical protein